MSLKRLILPQSLYQKLDDMLFDVQQNQKANLITIDTINLTLKNAITELQLLENESCNLILRSGQTNKVRRSSVLTEVIFKIEDNKIVDVVSVARYRTDGNRVKVQFNRELTTLEIKLFKRLGYNAIKNSFVLRAFTCFKTIHNGTHIFTNEDDTVEKFVGESEIEEEEII